MTTVAVSPRSFRQVPGRHQELLARHGLQARYASADRHLTEDEMIELVRGCDALIVGIDPVSERVLDAAPLRVVAKYGSGLDNIDLDAAEGRGIMVAPTPGANSHAVAELTIAFLFALARRLVPHHMSAAAGTWERHVGVELAGKRLGLVGLGHVGSRVARMAEAFGMEVAAHDPLITSAEVPLLTLDELVSSSDAVSLHLPLTDATRHMVGATLIDRMSTGSFLINTARSGLTDLDAVIAALESGRLAGVAIDDFEVRPEIGSRLWRHPGFLASPHAGASTVEAVERTGIAAVQIVLEVLGIDSTEAQRQEDR